MKGKRILSFILSAAMVLGLFAGNPVNVNAAEVNLAEGKRATVSSYESGTSFDAAKLVDGDTSTSSRWGTAQNVAANEWAEIDLGAEMEITKVKIHFERPDDQQNILSYKVETCGADGVYESVHQKDEKASQVEEITFDELKTVQKVKLTILNADGGTIDWVNVGVCEIEVYGEEGQGGGDGETTPSTGVVDTENVNHVRNASMSASSVEDNASTLAANKSNDGNTSTRWSSANQQNHSSTWLQAEFDKLTKIKQINLTLESRSLSPSPSNLKKFVLKYVDADGQEQTVGTFENTEVSGQDGYESTMRIKLDDAIVAKSIKLCEFEIALHSQWNSVGIVELEAYSNEITATATLDGAVSYIEETFEGTEIAADVTQLEMPEVEGYTVTINGADFEQIVADDGAVVHPLVDKTIYISYVVTQNATGESAKTEDVAYVVKGVNTQAEGKNEKPVIIPEIAEWYSESTEKLAVADVTKVVYSDAALVKVVDEFIADYEDFTGVQLTKKQGAAEAGAFNFVLEAPDALLGEEGYTMDIQADRIIVKSESTTGNMYGMQTILQMYKQDAEGFAIGQMRDYPKFEVRGLLLDVARKPISMEMIQYIGRSMRYYKMNDFQIHLSDNLIFLEDYMENGQNSDQMIALEKAYEAYRLECDVTNDEGESPTAKDYYFTKDEFRAYIQEQRAMGMNIVPELDFPAHSNSFTKVWPELAVQNQWGNRLNNPNRPLIDHLDVSKEETRAKIKEIFDDYTTGENPVFDAETTVHAGADEFVANYDAYRNYFNEIVPYVKETNPVRIWGGLTWITHEPGQPLVEIIPEAIEGVQMNLWSSGWASGPQMYEMGYDLINTIDSYGYMVPNGGKGRGAYGDLLNVNAVFNEFMPNRVAGGGWTVLPAGDPQVLGSVYAIWSDNIDTRACGLTESDYFWRFFDALPFYAEKNWAATGKEKGTAAALTALAEEQGIGPRINPYYQEDKIGNTYESYDFVNGLADASENDRNLTAGKNAQVADGALVLNGGESYVTSPIDRIGNDNELSFDIRLEKPAKAGDIIFETDAHYGTHDIRVMEDGKLGFTRELYSYYFDYELPVGKTVNIKIVAKQQETSLYVDDTLVGTASGKFIHNDMVKKSGIGHSTFAIPVERIGSKTNAIEAIIDNVVVASSETVDLYNKAAWTGTTDTETIYDESEGLLEYAFDNNSGTIWHSNWQGASDKLTGNNTFYAELNFGQKYLINQFSFTPRTPQASGYVTKADLYIKANADDEWIKVAEDKVFAANGDKKIFAFEEQEVQFVKFVAKDSSDGWVAVSEFDIANKPIVESAFVVYAEAEGNGTVAGGTSVAAGTEVTVTATPADGATFAGWYNAVTDELVSEDAAYTFTVTGNTSLTAKFEGGGTVTPPACEHETTKVVGKVDATCTEAGYTGDTVCVACDHEITKGSVIPAKGHTEVVDAAVAATCTEKGLTEGKHCSVCNTVLKAQEEVAALGHEWSGWTVVKEATTEAEGSKERTCSVCKEKETAVIPKLDVEPEEKPTTPPVVEEENKVTASKVTSNAVSLKWDAVAAAETYKVVIYNANNLETPMNVYDDIKATEFTISGLKQKAEYVVKVFAVNSLGESETAMELTASTPAAAAPAPSTPAAPTTPAAPATGDSANIYGMILMMGFAVLAFVSAYRRKNNF